MPSDQTKAINDKWAFFKEKGEFVQAFDPSRGAVGLDFARRTREDLFEPAMSPVSARDWALYFAVDRATWLSVVERPLSDMEAGSRVTYDQWRRTDVSALRSLYGGYARGRFYDSAVVDWPLRD